MRVRRHSQPCGERERRYGTHTLSFYGVIGATVSVEGLLPQAEVATVSVTVVMGESYKEV